MGRTRKREFSARGQEVGSVVLQNGKSDCARVVSRAYHFAVGGKRLVLFCMIRDLI